MNCTKSKSLCTIAMCSATSPSYKPGSEVVVRRVWYCAFRSDGPNLFIKYFAIFTDSGVWNRTAKCSTFSPTGPRANTSAVHPHTEHGFVKDTSAWCGRQHAVAGQISMISSSLPLETAYQGVPGVSNILACAATASSEPFTSSDMMTRRFCKCTPKIHRISKAGAARAPPTGHAGHPR